MASTFLFTRRLLLLQFLLPLFWAPLGAGIKIITVQAPLQVSGFLGETVILSCQLYPLEHDVTVTQVTWTKQRQAELARSVAVFHPAQGPSFHESSRLEFTAAKPGEKLWDASLVVRELRVEDEANYTCQFATFPNGDKSARTLLRVLAKPQNKAETLDISLSPNPVPVARCISVGGHPPARISWSSDGKTNTTQVPGPLPGTVTVISLLILTPSSQMDGRNVTCRVEHESFEEPEVLPITLAVSAPPKVSISGYDDNWYIGRREVALNCDVRSKPEPTGYNWSTTNGTLPPSAVAQGSQLLIHTVDETINATFICLVTNALGTSQANVTVLLRESPREQPHEGSSSMTVIIVASVIPLVVMLVLLICYCWHRKSRQNQYSPSTNGMVRYSAVGSNFQDPPTEGTG
ncbi:poliovirus receptor [Odocoileus virginianus]|uniref:Poliovirus receptor n=1 Tax=Odocoileus virginianus TaxID=9874 RepID=A0A6J0XLA6_ODOVR